MGSNPKPHTQEKTGRYTLEWTSVSYRTIASYVVLGLLLLGALFYIISPGYFTQKIKSAVERISSGMVQGSGTESHTLKKDAHFVNLDGQVRVKKAGAVQWLRASYDTGLGKGDFVQTGSDGVARIIFADGTSYMVKPDSLIVVEETREDPATRQTRVAVQVSSGAVDLSTGRFEAPGSTSQVSFSDAVANLAQESRAVVRNYPSQNVHEFTVDHGHADVRRGSVRVRLGQYEQVTFSSEKPGLTRRKVIAPPTLATPVNMALTVSRDPKATPVDFSWSPVADAVAYHLQISPSAMFSNFVVDRKIVKKTSTEVVGLDEGTYYWAVSSIDAKGVESQPSPVNRFNLVQQAEAGKKAFLEITRIVQHGRVVEVVGRTEPGSSVIINNEQVFSIAPDGTFRHFTSPLPKSGSNMITITAQNRKGETNTIHKMVVIE